MNLYTPETDSILLQKWWIDLNLDQAEFENLFTKPLRNLSALGSWIQAPTTRFFYHADGRGFWLCAWIEPLLTHGAQVGAWIRKDKRGTRAAVKAMDEFYEMVLEKSSVLIGLTRQYPKLHDLHLKLGYVYVDEFPGVFDGHSVWMYKMTRETRDGRAVAQDRIRQERRAAYEHERRQVLEQQQHEQSLRGDAGEVRGSEPEGRGARDAAASRAGRRSLKDWWNHKPDSNHQSPG